jgi:neutral ceramidase
VLKKLAATLALAAVAALILLAVVPLHAERPRAAPHVVSEARGTGPLSAGAASVALDAAAGTPVAGFPRLRWASDGVRDVPRVNALVLREEGLSAAIVSADILLVTPELRRRVEARLADLGLGALLLAATHTHAGPGGYWDDRLGARIATGPFEAARLESLAARVEQSVRAAVGALAPARLSVARTRVAGLSRNRDGGVTDGRLLVLRVERQGAGPAAVLGQVVVFPAHATLLGSRNRLLSGDWPAELSRSLPGTTVFLQGAVGDQSVDLPGGASDPAAYGRALAAEVERLPFPPGQAAPPLAAARAEVALPSPSFGAVPAAFQRLFQNLLWGWLPARAAVLALRVGPALLVAVPAEPGEEVGRRWRAALGPDAEVVSLAGDYLGYVESPQRVLARTGEAARTYLGPDLAFVLGDGLVAAAAAADRAGP